MEFRRYFFRSIHALPSIDTLDVVEISPYNQYDSMILPIIDWLKKHGVTFMNNTKITDLNFEPNQDKKTVNCIYYNRK